MLIEGELAVLCLETVDVACSIGRLRRYIFVKWVPGYTLHVMIVLCYLAYHLSCAELAIYLLHHQTDTTSIRVSYECPLRLRRNQPLKSKRRREVLTRLSIVYACDIVHAPSDEEDSVR